MTYRQTGFSHLARTHEVTAQSQKYIYIYVCSNLLPRDGGHEFLDCNSRAIESVLIKALRQRQMNRGLAVADRDEMILVDGKSSAAKSSMPFTFPYDLPLHGRPRSIHREPFDQSLNLI